MKTILTITNVVIFALLIPILVMNSSCAKKANTQGLPSRSIIHNYDQLLKRSHLVFSSTLSEPKKEIVDGFEMLVYGIATTDNVLKSDKYSSTEFNGVLTQGEHVCDVEKIWAENCESIGDGGTNECNEEWTIFDPCPFDDEHYLPPLGVPVVVFASFANEGHAEIQMVFRIANDAVDLSILGGPVVPISDLTSIAEDPRFIKS